MSIDSLGQYCRRWAGGHEVGSQSSWVFGAMRYTSDCCVIVVDDGEVALGTQ